MRNMRELSNCLTNPREVVRLIDLKEGQHALDFESDTMYVRRYGTIYRYRMSPQAIGRVELRGRTAVAITDDPAQDSKFYFDTMEV